jgi:hypothetical protein
MRLEFDNGVLVDLARADYDRLRDTKQWVIQFRRPPSEFCDLWGRLLTCGGLVIRQ